MKIGILTYHFSDNYGALFQAYALRQWFIQHGHDAVFVKYHPKYVEAGGDICWKKPLSKSNVKVLFLKIMSLKEKMFGNRAQKDGFNSFREIALGVTGEEYKDIKHLNRDRNTYDLLVCGSDQIWKPSEHYGVDPVYFLSFETQGNPRKISYAPSFGKDTLEDLYVNDVASLIKALDAVSVRELSGCKIISQITGIEATCVPDPTFLIRDYSSIMRPYSLGSKKSKHVFCYALRSRDTIGEVAEILAERLQCDLVSPHNPHRRWPEIGRTIFPCPMQWLHLLSTSEYVVTNSFHGAALSILLNKKFVVIGLQGKRGDFNARVKNLLKLVGLESRYFEKVNSLTIDFLLNTIIDWDTVNGSVSKLREKGQSYLQDQLEKTNESI